MMIYGPRGMKMATQWPKNHTKITVAPLFLSTNYFREIRLGVFYFILFFVGGRVVAKQEIKEIEDFDGPKFLL